MGYRASPPLGGVDTSSRREYAARVDSATICAIATAPAAGGIGVIRVSGPLALEAVRPLVPALPTEVEPRRAYFADLKDRSGAVLDQGLVLYFQAPHSYTGEDVIELQAHGGPKLMSLLLREVLADGRVRLAQPGEFSRRAFLNGRMDLSRAEAVAALVAAESDAAVRAAAAQLSGSLAERVKVVRTPLVELRADLEGVLEYPDEAGDADVGAARRVEELAGMAQRLLADADRGALVRRGARVVLFGPVNAGKSTLFNALAGEERALVDPEPGTTRDVLEARIEVQGLPLTLVDTAGLRPEPGRVEALGIARARQALAGADLAVLLVPPDEPDGQVQAWLAEAGSVPTVVVASKADLTRDPCASHSGPSTPLRSAQGERQLTYPPFALSLSKRQSALPVSGLTGLGVPELRDELARKLWGSGAPSAQFIASESSRDAMQRAVDALDRAAKALEVSTLEVVCGELGLATEALGEITGESASDELLDAIFRRFCVGK